MKKMTTVILLTVLLVGIIQIIIGTENPEYMFSWSTSLFSTLFVVWRLSYKGVVDMDMEYPLIITVGMLGNALYYTVHSVAIFATIATLGALLASAYAYKEYKTNFLMPINIYVLLMAVGGIIMS